MAKIFFKTGKVKNLITKQNLGVKFMAVFWLEDVKIVGYFDDGADEMSVYFSGEDDTLRVAYVKEGAINRLVSVSRLCATGSGSLVDRPMAAMERRLGTENMLKFCLIIGLLLAVSSALTIVMFARYSSISLLPLYFSVKFFSEAWSIKSFMKEACRNEARSDG
ncbi:MULTISPECIES: hypothetical protein [Campylobacter]|uniref:Uncharacterized protein n=1 Tax=Campylobacter curvus (strain 525.92) TaxID=360105 RepID=A7GZ10_CAMC5|nr:MULTISPECIES: hypothetical protein [Campylobacter]EAT99553.1 hypothetical protein CCV52592_0076 [Campylobacter curvus 525.92]EJP74509.1 hypothetical protein HMPREF1139_1070 [Campylobacter sp. FOBRC14]